MNHAQKANKISKSPKRMELSSVMCAFSPSAGPTWKKLRSPWNHSMMKTSNVYEGIEALNEINTEFIDRLLKRRNEENLVENIDRELFRWSLESKSVQIS